MYACPIPKRTGSRINGYSDCKSQLAHTAVGVEKVSAAFERFGD
jgi:hypothetical protein